MKNKLSSIRVGLIKNKSKEKSLNKLKYSFNYKEIQTIQKEILTRRLPGRKEFIEPLFTSKYEDISNGLFLYKKPSKETLFRELDWNFSLFKLFAEHINSFLNLQQQFENEFILGNYFNSNMLLNKIETEISMSIWSMEKRFIQEEYQNGLEGNKRFLKEINRINDDPIIIFLSDFISFRVEENTTFQQYLNKLKRLSEVIHNEMLQSYFNYKLAYGLPMSSKEISYILIMESKNSLIDCYLTTIKLCKHMISNPEFEMYHGHIFNNLTELYEVIDDPNIQNILLYINPKNKVNNINNSFFEISDLYTEGKYNEVLEETMECLKNNSNVFELYEFYLKSLMYVKSDFLPIDQKNNLQNKIMENMFYLYTKRGKFHDSSKDLLKIYIVLGDFDISFKIDAFLTRKHLVKFNKHINMYSELSSKYITPRFSLIYKEREKAIIFLENIDKKTTHGKTIKFFYTSFLDTLDSQNIPLVRKNIQLAKVWMDNKFYKEAIDLLENVLRNILKLKDKAIFDYLQEKVNVLLFNLFLMTEEVQKSMEIYVENYLIHSNLVGRMDLRYLISVIENKDCTDIKSSIYNPLLSYIYYKNDSTKVYRSFANYMDLNGFIIPSRIPNNNFPYSNIKLLVEFLSKVCTLEVLESDVLNFQNEEDIRKERINICQKLLELDNESEYEYIKEITEITQKIKVNKKLREIDESRIDVNIKGIKNDQESIFRENFKRYITSQRTVFDLMILNINDISTINELNDISDIKKKIKIQDQGFLLFKEVISDLRDQFAFNSKYGLDSALSTRIRHGALLNELRRPFEKYNLILSKKNKEIDMYDLSKHWLQNLSYYKFSHLQDKLKDILGAFSKKIDRKIDLLNNNYMRIRTENKNHLGLFDLAFYDYDLFQLYQYFNKDLKDDSEEFFEIIMKIMWKSTEDSLMQIRNVLKDDIEKDFLVFLDELQIEILNFSDLEETQILTELSSNIINCRTELQIQIEKISNWFKLSANTEFSDFDALVLVDTCIETLGNLNKYKKVAINKEVNTNLVFRGDTFTYLTDILNIFISNAMQHSMFEDLSDLIIRISINEESDYVNLTVENNISQQVDQKVLQAKIKDINTKVNDLEYIKQYHANEGGSGYIKIFKILHYNLITQFKIQLDIKQPNIFHVNISIKKHGLAKNID